MKQMSLLTEESNKILQSDISVDNIDFNIKTEKNYAIVERTIKEYISKFKGTNITSLILGCTHYPILEEKIQKEIGNGVKLINAGVMSALDSIKYLKENNIQNLNAENGTREFFHK